MKINPELDYNDILILETNNRILNEVVTKLNELIDEQTSLKIILLDEIEKVDMSERLSFENKIIKIRPITEHKDWVDDYIKVEAEIKKTENIKHQVEEQIKSIKKKIEVLPR